MDGSNLPVSQLRNRIGLLLFLSGAAALAHQTLWTRRLVDLLGASSNTFSQVIGAFFCGLALGSGFAAWSISRNRPTASSHWSIVGKWELAVALFALTPLLSLHFIESFQQFASAHLTGRSWLAALFIVPPAFCMGCVLPWTLESLRASPEGLTPRQTILLYSINTLGGIAGIIGVTFTAWTQWNIQWTGFFTCLLNMMVAFGFFRMAPPPTSPPTKSAPLPSSMSDSTSSSLPFPVPLSLFLAWASGFIVLALEVILQHQFAQITINSFFSSATILLLVLAGLGMGGLLIPSLKRPTSSPHSLLRLGLAAAAIFCLAQPWILNAIHPRVQSVPYEWHPVLYILIVLTLGSIAVLPVFLCSGMVFPILLGIEKRRYAFLLAINGIGGWMGAECAEFFLMPKTGLWASMVWLGAAYALLLSILSLLPPRPKLTQSKFVLMHYLAGPLLLVLAALIHSPSSNLDQVALKKNETLIEVRTGREGVVAVVRFDAADQRIIFNNTYTLGGSKAQPHQERQGLLPLLLHGHPQKIAQIGVATGSTIAGAALCPTIEHIDAIELSPIVLDFARTHFQPFNRNVFSDPRVHFIQEDGRWVMATQIEKYDVVIGDLFLPWRTGEGRLFTLEHFRSVRRSLTRDGLYCQWLPLFQLTHDQFMTICRTFQSIYPNAIAIRGDFFTEFPILGLVGFQNPKQSLDTLSWPTISNLCANIRAQNKVNDPLLRQPEAVAMQILGPLPAPDEGPLNTLGNAWLEWDAGANIIGLQKPWFVGVPCAEWMRAVHQTGIESMPGSLRSAHDAGQFLLTLEIAARVKSSITTNLQSQVRERLPASLLSDPHAQWQNWPMRHPIGIQPPSPPASP